jgi:hypothetical protein
MFMRLIRSLMPREQGFVEQFVAHSGQIVAAADALVALMEAGPNDRAARVSELSAIESRADDIARETVVGLHRAFITPFDRSDIHALSHALDDTVDLIEEVALHAEMYRVTEWDGHMKAMAGMIQRCAKMVAEVIPLLNDIAKNAEAIRTMCETVSRIEGEADDVLRRALTDLVEQSPDTITFFGRKEVYELLEAVTDRCDDVADVVEGIVLDHV